MNESVKDSPKKPKGFWQSLMEKLDGKMKSKAAEQSCCGGSKEKDKGPDKTSCCS